MKEYCLFMSHHNSVIWPNPLKGITTDSQCYFPFLFCRLTRVRFPPQISPQGAFSAERIATPGISVRVNPHPSHAVTCPADPNGSSRENQRRSVHAAHPICMRFFTRHNGIHIKPLLTRWEHPRKHGFRQPQVCFTQCKEEISEHRLQMNDRCTFLTLVGDLALWLWTRFSCEPWREYSVAPQPTELQSQTLNR